MRALFYSTLLLFFVAGCDFFGSDTSSDFSSHEITYRTPLTDGATGVTVLDNGDLVIYGITQGYAAPTDGTNAFPLLLRMHSDGSFADTTVYRDDGYGRVAGAVPFEDGTAVLTSTRTTDETGSTTFNVSLYRVDLHGTRTDVLYSQSDAYASPHSLLRMPDGGFLLVARLDDDNLIKLDARGAVDWTHQMPDLHNIHTAAVPNGDLFVLGTNAANQFAIARLDPTGQERWRRTYGDETAGRRIKGFTATDYGVAVLMNYRDNGSTTIHLTRIDGEGEMQWERSYATGHVDATAVTALGTHLALAWTQDATPQQPGGERASIALLDPQGNVRSHYSFGPQQNTTTRVSDIAPYGADRFVAVGSTGPARVSGYGGGDFDVLIKLFNRPR